MRACIVIVLMENYFHLVVQTRLWSLSWAMRRLNVRFQRLVEAAAEREFGAPQAPLVYKPIRRSAIPGSDFDVPGAGGTAPAKN